MRRRISSSGSVNGGLAGGIHPSFTTQKRKMVDLPHPGVPPSPTPCPHRSLSVPLFFCPRLCLSLVVSCFVWPRKSWSFDSAAVHHSPCQPRQIAACYALLIRMGEFSTPQCQFKVIIFWKACQKNLPKTKANIKQQGKGKWTRCFIFYH